MYLTGFETWQSWCLVFIFSDGSIEDEWLNIKKSDVFSWRQSAGVGVPSFRTVTILLMKFSQLLGEKIKFRIMQVCISPMKQVQIYFRYIYIFVLFIPRNSLSLKSVSCGCATGKVQNQIFKTNSTRGETLNNFMFFLQKGCEVSWRESKDYASDQKFCYEQSVAVISWSGT